MDPGALTWPPEKATATTPSSLPADRNLGGIVEGEVIMVVVFQKSLKGGMMRIRRLIQLGKGISLVVITCNK